MKDEFEASVKSGVTPDPRWIRKHDEIVVKTIKKTREKALKTLFFLALTVAAAFINPIVAVVLGIITAGCLFILVCSGQRMPNSFLKEIYEEGLLAPGMIVKTQPLTVAVLVNMAAVEDAPSRYGCFFLEVSQLPGLRGELYEKVPCSCMFRYKEGAYHTTFQPHPLNWATADAMETEAALRTLEQDQQEDGRDLWTVIKDVAAQFTDIPNEFIVELDETFQPVGLKHYQENEFKPYVTEAMNGNYQKTEQKVERVAADLPFATEFNKLAELAEENEVGDYINKSCIDRDYPFHNNPGFFTYFGEGVKFLETEQKRKFALAEGEAPLLGGNVLLTTKGGWKSKQFTPWKELALSARLNGDGEIEALVNGELTAVMPCHIQEYVNSDVFSARDAEAVREIERQHIQRFLEEIKQNWEER